MTTNTSAEKLDVEPAPNQSSEPITGASPTVTVVATGPATFSRQICQDDEAEIVATHEVSEITIEHEINTADAFEQVLDPQFKGRGPTLCKNTIIDRLLDEHTMDGYVRAGGPDAWSLTIVGTAEDWKELGLAMEPEGNLHRKGGRIETVCWNLRDLASDEFSNDSAVLAALDLIEHHDIDCSRSLFTDLLIEEESDE